jgi:hypothetical protein
MEEYTGKLEGGEPLREVLGKRWTLDKSELVEGVVDCVEVYGNIRKREVRSGIDVEGVNILTSEGWVCRDTPPYSGIVGLVLLPRPSLVTGLRCDAHVILVHLRLKHS